MRSVSPDEYLRGVSERLRAGEASITTETFRGVPAVVGYRAEFRLRWLATKLNLFVIVLAQPEVSADGMKSFSSEALDFANSQKGRFRGLQNGVAALAVQVGSDIHSDAVEFAENTIVKRFSAFAWPAVVDLSSGKVHRHQGRVPIGGIYAQWMRQQTDLALLDEPHITSNGRSLR